MRKKRERVCVCVCFGRCVYLTVEKSTSLDVLSFCLLPLVLLPPCPPCFLSLSALLPHPPPPPCFFFITPPFFYPSLSCGSKTGVFDPQDNGPIQWVRGSFGPKPSAVARSHAHKQPCFPSAKSPILSLLRTSHVSASGED